MRLGTYGQEAPRAARSADAHGIGTLGEMSLHAGIKRWYVQPGDELESRVDGYLVDIVRGELLVEVQTRHFGALKRKLARLLDRHPVRLVYPIAREKWIVRLDADGQTVLGRRRSPKRGQLSQVFQELVSIASLATHPRFALEVLWTSEEEWRCHDGRGSWRRQGWSIRDHLLLGVTGSVTFSSPADYATLLPASLSEPFSTSDLARCLSCRLVLARKVAYCLRGMGLFEVAGKRGRAPLYRRSNPTASLSL